ncbi:MAG: glutamate synthase-related protein [Aggregatilineales bacterium]
MNDKEHMTQDEYELHPLDTQPRDACALICAVRKGGQATHGNVKRTIEGLARMGHRTGYIDGEGDGVGILTDIPRQLWTKRLAQIGLRSSLATDRNFWVAHLMIPASDRNRAQHLIEEICRQIAEAGLHVLIDQKGNVNRQVLGPNAEKNEPVFWQIAGMNGQIPAEKLDQTLFELQIRLEEALDVHFASFSSHSVVYKVQGTVEILRRYYPELRDPDYASTITLGHARYSTNTNPIFERAQPFGLMGHNGEFNTISRFRMEANMLGIPLAPDNSDSQDVDRALQALCMRYDLDLIEAMEFIFPPHDFDLIQNTPELHEMYRNMRQAFGPYAQGPAAVVARLGNLAVFSVDALGLRPLWFGETEKEYFASSERGVYPLDMMSASPKPMAPGEKIALRIQQGHSIEVLDYPAIQRHVFNRQRESRQYSLNPTGFGLSGDQNYKGNGKGNGHGIPSLQQQFDALSTNVDYSASTQPPVQVAESAEQLEPVVAIKVQEQQPAPWHITETPINTKTMAALGWERYHSTVLDTLGETRKETIGSLGWDGPLAAMSYTRTNIADYFKETVAVVTNPAIDKERESAQFSTTVIIGERPLIREAGEVAADRMLIELNTPLLVGGHPDLGDIDVMNAVADRNDTMSIESVMTYFGDKAVILSISAATDETIDGAIERIGREAVRLVKNGARCVILDDTEIFGGSYLWIDPLLATAAVDRSLRQTENPDTGMSFRREAGIVLRSGSLRDLHDLALCVSMGANAVLPYALYAVAIGIAPRSSKDNLDNDVMIERLDNTLKTLIHGLQKVISTIGCHELRGYGHSFSSIGLTRGIATIFGTPNYFGSESRGLTWTNLKDDADERASELRGEKTNRLVNPDRFYPKVWKKIEDVAHGEMTLEEYTETLFKLEEKHPVAIRHILGLKESDAPTNPEDVDISIGEHDMPILISAMSFGSQGELAYKTYAEAAYLLNILCVNGEGGELPDIMGKYPRNRGQQIASGRFGVNIGFLNSCNLLEIKIGQGAKPGEGGQLPGFKVTEQVAEARSTVPGVGLISPSNNHDLYSIEDLAQLIDELKTANPNARVSVKIPVVPGVGIIAVGVAKAGADIINITGYDGGTGAARAHSLRHVGGPTEVGVWLSHRALIESGLRDDVELWCDGGMKSGRDVVKMLCLGANRVGFGTLAMVAVGCTICRGCHDGTCHVGITTHVKTREEAEMKGFKAFRPFEEKGTSQGIVNMFNLLADDIRKWTAKLGISRAQDLVGRADLLEQIDMHNRIDLTPLLRRVPPAVKKQAQPGGRRLTRPRNTLSKQITSVVAEYVERGDKEMTYDDEQVMAMDRALGTHLAGAIKRGDIKNVDNLDSINLSFSNSAIPGNGLGAFTDNPIKIWVEGGAQDGVGKCAKDGVIAILKGLNHNGARLDGSVGKSFAYGAQGGFFIVQGDADTRACIRLSGSSVVFGGEIRNPIRDEDGNIGSRANLKGYACEYMTSGRVLILGDPGPWMCAGMTGGVIYQRVQPEMGLTLDALKRRIAKGSVVDIFPLDEFGIEEIHEMLNRYIQTLEVNNQAEATGHLYKLLRRPQEHFVKIAPPARVN